MEKKRNQVARNGQQTSDFYNKKGMLEFHNKNNNCVGKKTYV